MTSLVTDPNANTSLLISSLHHRVRGAIGRIALSSQMLLTEAGGPLNENQKLCLEHISKESKWLVIAAEAFATLAHIKSGKSIRLEKVDLAICINEVVETCLPQIQAKEQSLIVECSDLPSVSANVSHVTDILSHLLDNAYRYTPSGGKITITGINLDQWVRVMITDTGIGIASKDQEEIFAPLFRVAHPMVQEQEGLGLGLFFVKSYVEYFGGKIGIESEVGQGSKFWFTLPVATKTP